MKLFKYVTYDILYKIINGYIRFTPPGQFNDPFEIPGIMAAEARARFSGVDGLMKQTQDIVESLMSSPSTVPDAARISPLKYFMGSAGTSESEKPDWSDEELQQQILDRINAVDSTYGILSLTETNENLLMWAHYADDHRGAVLEFELDDGFLYSNDPDRKFAGSVTYSNKRAQIPRSEEVLMQHFFIKSPEWQYEKEFRIVRRLELADMNNNGIHLFKLPLRYLRHIYLGVRTEHQKVKDLIAHITKEPLLKHIECLKARLDPGQFKLIFDEITSEAISSGAPGTEEQSDPA